MLTAPLADILNSGLLSMWGALILHWLLPLQHSHYHPITLWRYLAETVSDKVNIPERSIEQQRLSGTLALAVMYLPAFGLLAAIALATPNTAMLNAVLLWLALGWRPIYNYSNQLASLLKRAKKPAARQLLAKIVKRDTSHLSEIELTKLSSEMLLTGYARNLINVLFFYALGGGLAAMLYTLLMQLNREWSPRLPSYRYFGQNLAKILLVVEWLPTRLFGLFLTLGHDCLASVKNLAKQPYQSNAEFIWSAAGSKYQIALGGNAIYDDSYLQRNALGGESIATANHFSKLYQSINKRSLVWIGLQSMIMYMVAL